MVKTDNDVESRNGPHSKMHYIAGMMVVIYSAIVISNWRLQCEGYGELLTLNLKKKSTRII